MVSREQWLKEGGIEHPTHLETLTKPEQQERIVWLKKACGGATEILDLGCSWGYVLNELNGSLGVDINAENIDLAIKKFPGRRWIVGDIRKDLAQFEDKTYAIVLLCDVLEHLSMDEARRVLIQAVRIARRKVLITLPIKLSPDCALCFKHVWIPDDLQVSRLLCGICRRFNLLIRFQSTDYFFFVEIDK